MKLFYMYSYYVFQQVYALTENHLNGFFLNENYLSKSLNDGTS